MNINICVKSQSNVLSRNICKKTDVDPRIKLTPIANWWSGGSKILEGVTLETRRELRGSGLTGEFYAFVIWDVGIISNIYIAQMNELLCDESFIKFHFIKEGVD